MLKQHVTLEEYNASLRDSVNSYYTHLKNNMSPEEAIEKTMGMSERYLNAVEEFNNNIDVQAGEEISDNNAVETSEGIEI